MTLQRKIYTWSCFQILGDEILIFHSGKSLVSVTDFFDIRKHVYCLFTWKIEADRCVLINDIMCLICKIPWCHLIFRMRKIDLMYCRKFCIVFVYKLFIKSFEWHFINLSILFFFLNSRRQTFHLLSHLQGV